MADPRRLVIDAVRLYLHALDQQRHPYIKTARNAPTEAEVASNKIRLVRDHEQALRDALHVHDQEADDE